MKNLFWNLLLTFCSLQVLGQSDFPLLSQKGIDIDDLIPQNWRLIDSTQGDLNLDGINDIAFVIQDTNKENFELYDGYAVDSFDQNPRILAIYFGDQEGSFNKKLQANKFIIIANSPYMDEPFGGLSIDDDGILRISFYFWYSTGSWYTSNHQYKFKYQNNTFELIEYEFFELHRATNESIEYIINFSTREMNIKEITYDEETKEEIVMEGWQAFSLKELKSIETLEKPFNWKIGHIFI